MSTYGYNYLSTGASTNGHRTVINCALFVLCFIVNYLTCNYHCVILSYGQPPERTPVIVTVNVTVIFKALSYTLSNNKTDWTHFRTT